MKIDAATLNWVTTIDRDDGSTLYIHSVPLMRETFERYAVILAQTFSAIHDKNIGLISAPRVAAILLRDLSEKDGTWITVGDRVGVEQGLVAEIRRLSNVLVHTDKGWKPTGFDDAIRRKLMTEDEASEAMGFITFFIVFWAMQRKDQRASLVRFAAGIWGAQITSLGLMEFAASLETSTEAPAT